MKQRPTKAIIPVAGYGTRRLPMSKVIEKCMVPILNRPLIDYIVRDCQKAGIKEIIFVVSGQGEQLKRYYAPDPDLNDYLKIKGKTTQLEEMESIGRDLDIKYVEQDRGIYGTAVPIWMSKDLVGDEPFVVLMGDDFILRHDGGSSVASLIEAWLASDSEHALLGVEIPKKEVNRYGVLKFDENNHLQSIVEKPDINVAPSSMINVSKYVFSPSIIGQLAKYMATPQSGEYMLTEVVDIAIEQGKACMVVPAHGVYLDGGTVEGWLYANNYLSEHGLDRH